MADAYDDQVYALSVKVSQFLNEADVQKAVGLAALLTVLGTLLRQAMGNAPDSAVLIHALIPALLRDIRDSMRSTRES